MLPFTREELDITNARLVEETISVERPNLIINCAVLGVEACEIAPEKAWSVNVAGAENLASSAARSDAALVHISTNYVFDGQPSNSNGAFYTIKDVPKPINS